MSVDCLGSIRCWNPSRSLSNARSRVWENPFPTLSIRLHTLMHNCRFSGGQSSRLSVRRIQDVQEAYRMSLAPNKDSMLHLRAHAQAQST